MTDSPTPDELVSAHLDGEASPDDDARVLADPHLRSRRQAFVRLREELGDLEMPTPARREANIAAALAVYDELAAAPAGGETDATVVDLTAARRRRRLAVLAAAAAVLVAALGVTALRQGLGGDANEDVATSATATLEEADEASAELDFAQAEAGATEAADRASPAAEEEAPMAAESVPADQGVGGETALAEGAPAPVPRDLGAVADLDALAAALSAVPAAPPPTTVVTLDPDTEAALACVDSVIAPTDVVLDLATARLLDTGTTVAVVVVDDDSGPRALVVAPPACTITVLDGAPGSSGGG